MPFGYSLYLWLIKYLQPLYYVQPARILSLLFLLFATTYVIGQDRCGTIEYMKLKEAQRQINEKNEVFERWLGERATKLKQKKSNQRTQATYQVPVVVHVIHNGENDATNIPDAQIISQIRVLNADFNRTNSDAGLTPSDFVGVAGSMDIEFVLAKQDPNGLSTNGIVRVAGPQTSWSINDNYKLKALSYWPSEDYLNIWVCKLTGYIGYAQFPQTDLVSGLENSSMNRLTDGVVITYNAFGSDDDGDFILQSRYNKGRTTTHEVGHFFGLRHIWGDQSTCGTDGDYVSDTPDQDGETTGCPTHPKTACSNAVMFQNYLDYTNDVCMNMFSQGQVERMTTVIENSPRRQSLLSSHGSSEPAPIPDNLSISEIISPLSGTCSGTITPEIEVVNYGTNQVTSAEVVLFVNNSPIETKTFILSLDPAESARLTFASANIPSGTASFTFEINKVNNVDDLDELNNTKTQNVTLPSSVGIPFAEDFSPFPSGWTIQNPDATEFTWKVADAPKDIATNKAMKMDFYSYEDNFGEIDLLITPTFDLTDAPVATVLFDISYAQYQGSDDGLKVIALDACNPDISTGTILYNKSGSALKTHDSTSEPYAPENENDWRTESIDLTAFLGQSNVQLAFVGVNDYGNSLYLDDVRIVTELVNNLTLQEVLAPGPVTCTASLAPQLRIRNSGSPVTSFTIDYVVNGVERTHEVTGLNMSFGDIINVTLPVVALDNTNLLSFTIVDPNGMPDVNSDDNTLVWQTVVNTKAASFPVEEGFEANFENRWVTVNPGGDKVWEPFTIDDNTTLKFEGYDYNVPDSRSWVVSPVLDLTGVDSLGLAFDVSYVTRDGHSDVLHVYTSTDCGESFTLHQTYSNVDLAVGDDDNPWTPNDDTDWVTKEISLEALAGQREARIALVFQNAGVNNIYIDNIRIVPGSTAEIKRGFEVFPNPLLSNDRISIIFNLPQSEDIVIEVFDSMGRVVFKEEKTGVMNQTDVLHVGQLSGMYTMRVKTSGKVYARKFIAAR